jgi:hypothetical protein
MTAGQALAFLLLGALNAYLGLWLFGYAAYWFLLVINKTAEGRNDVKVPWPDEIFRDRLGRLAHVCFLCLVWLLPIYGFFHYVPLPVSDELRPPLMLVITGVVLWLMLPISLLSSLTSLSHWEVFRWAVLRRLRERSSAWLAFYLYTLPLLFGCALVAYLALFGWQELRDAAEDSALTWLPTVVDVWSWVFVLPLTAIMAATTLLIYARLVGRLAWMMDFREEQEEEECRAPEPPTPSARLRAEHDVLEAAEQPMAASGDVFPFAEDPEPETAIVVSEVLTVEDLVPVVVLPASPPAPRRLWVRGIYRFPWYRASLKAWLFLTVVGFLLAALIRLQLHFRS